MSRMGESYSLFLTFTEGEHVLPKWTGRSETSPSPLPLALPLPLLFFLVFSVCAFPFLRQTVATCGTSKSQAKDREDRESERKSIHSCEYLTLHYPASASFSCPAQSSTQRVTGQLTRSLSLFLFLYPASLVLSSSHLSCTCG